MDALSTAVADFLAKIAGYLGAAGAGALYQKSRDEDAQDKAKAADLAKASAADAASKKQSQAEKVAYLKKQGLLRD